MHNYPVSLRLEGVIGSKPEDCAREILRVAKILDVVTLLDYNGVEMFALPHDTEEGVLEQFQRTLEIHLRQAAARRARTQTQPTPTPTLVPNYPEKGSTSS